MTKAINSSLLEILDREMKVEGFSLDEYGKAHAFFVGAGAVNWLVCLGLIKKGIRKLTICDGDSVTPSNLNRQFFVVGDIGLPKASALANNLSPWFVGDTQVIGIDRFVEEVHLVRGSDSPTLLVSCPDNNEARQYTSELGLKLGVPGVIIGLSEDSDYGYVFVQTGKIGDACWGCLQKGRTGGHQCGVAANINLPLLFSGVVLTACDALVSGVGLGWNYRRLSLSGKIPDMMKLVPVWEQCPICHDSELKR